MEGAPTPIPVSLAILPRDCLAETIRYVDDSGKPLDSAVTLTDEDENIIESEVTVSILGQILVRFGIPESSMIGRSTLAELEPHVMAEVHRVLPWAIHFEEKKLSKGENPYRDSKAALKLEQLSREIGLGTMRDGTGEQDSPDFLSTREQKLSLAGEAAELLGRIGVLVEFGDDDWGDWDDEW
jgi:hypothetical protein